MNDFDFDYDNLSENSEQAFTELERYFSSELDLDLQHAKTPSDRQSAYISYMSKTIAAASACNVAIGDEWQIPSHGAAYSVADEVKDFQAAVRRVILEIKITSARETKQNTYVLSGPDKETIPHLVDRMREIIDAARVTVDQHDSHYGDLDQ